MRHYILGLLSPQRGVMIFLVFIIAIRWSYIPLTH